MQITIIVDVEDDGPNADPTDDSGLTNAAYERLTGDTAEHGRGALAWLGSVESVQKTED